MDQAVWQKFALIACVIFTLIAGLAVTVASSPIAVSSVKDIRLSHQPMRILMSRSASNDRETALWSDLLSRARRGGSIHLVVEGIASKSPPGTRYNVYLGLPSGATGGGPSDPHYVGTIGFFDAVDGLAKEARFNITDRLRRLTADGNAQDEVSITLAPVGPPVSGADPKIGRLVIEAD
jgi:hypothetical protein